MLSRKSKKNQTGNRILVSITVLGSAGPIRFVVNEEELVAAVIDTALKNYAREGRLPVLGSDLNNFLLYCRIAGVEALNPWATIGSFGVRDFMLCKKPQATKAIDGGKTVSTAETSMGRKGFGSWKAWLHKSLNLKISSH